MAAIRSEAIPAEDLGGSGRRRRGRLELIDGGREGQRSAWHPSLGGRPRKRSWKSARVESGVRSANFLLRRLLVIAVGSAMILAVGVTGKSLVAGPAPVASGETHVVLEGETLWSIAAARKPGRDIRAEVEKLRRLNDVDSRIRPGQVLLIPA